MSPLIFLAKCFSSVKTWRRSVQHKRPRYMFPWDYRGLQQGFLLTSRQICPGRPRGWTLEHNQYWPNIQRNYPSTPIQPPVRQLFWEPSNRKMPPATTMDPYKHEWGHHWGVWYLQHQIMSRQTNCSRFQWSTHSIQLL